MKREQKEKKKTKTNDSSKRLFFACSSSHNKVLLAHSALVLHSQFSPHTHCDYVRAIFYKQFNVYANVFTEELRKGKE